jgi:hypothetical protein
MNGFLSRLFSFGIIECLRRVYRVVLDAEAVCGQMDTRL